MNVIFTSQRHNSSKLQKHNIAFGAGLTPKMIQEIKKADIIEISKELAQKGIYSDFKENKIIAWCSLKTVDIIEQFNRKWGTNLAMPKGIYVEDFENLNVDSQSAIGFCNIEPTYLQKNSKEKTPAKTIFFNSFKTYINQIPENKKWEYDWRYLSEHADKNYNDKFLSTDHFLEPFFHEFGHIFHYENMIYEIGTKKTIERLKNVQNKDGSINYNNKYSEIMSHVCNYAKENPPEAVACDISKNIADSLSEETLSPTKNPFIGTPYEHLSFWQRLNLPEPKNKEDELKEILRRFWNGKFD